MTSRLLLILCLVLSTSGCAVLFSSGEEPEPEPEEVFAVYPEPDFQISARLDSYRGIIEQQMGRRIATVTDTLRIGKPESALGNMAADALRSRAAAMLRSYVNVGVVGEDSFKVFFLPGELTVRDVYEFMPYENDLSVLTLNGEMIQKLCNQIAAAGGGPVSGLRFRLEDNRAAGVLINAEIVEPDKEYRVATSSYIADGGGNYPVLWEPLDRVDLRVSMRDIYISYFRNQVELSPETDGRIRL